MHKYLPSKKFSFILLSILLASGIVYASPFIINKIKPKPTGVLLTGAAAQSKVQEFMALDSDHDGLPDWEEALYKTDPKNPDTDGDGTSDGDEVKLNRDPLKANTAPKGAEPNDKIDASLIATDKKATADFMKLTTTDRVGQELFSQYLATRKVNTPLTQTDQQTIIANTLINLPVVTFKTYTINDIAIINSSDNGTLKDYSNNIAQIILNNINTSTESIDIIMTDFSATEDEAGAIEVFKRLDPLIAKSQKTVSGLLAVKVPQVLTSEHLAILNSFQEIYDGLTKMKDSAKDVVMLIPLLNSYDANVQNLATDLLNMVKKLSALKVTFTSQTDYGYQLFNVIMSKTN